MGCDFSLGGSHQIISSGAKLDGGNKQSQFVRSILDNSSNNNNNNNNSDSIIIIKARARAGC